MLEVLNGSKFEWRHLPHDFPPWKSVYTQYRSWMKSGIFEKIHEALWNKLRRVRNKKPTPTCWYGR